MEHTHTHQTQSTCGGCGQPGAVTERGRFAETGIIHDGCYSAWIADAERRNAEYAPKFDTCTAVETNMHGDEIGVCGANVIRGECTSCGEQY